MFGVWFLSPRPRVDCTKVPDLGETATKRLLLPVHTTEVCLHYYCRLVRLKTRLWGLWSGMFAQLEGLVLRYLPAHRRRERARSRFFDFPPLATVSPRRPWSAGAWGECRVACAGLRRPMAPIGAAGGLPEASSGCQRPQDTPPHCGSEDGSRGAGGAGRGADLGAPAEPTRVSGAGAR